MLSVLRSVQISFLLRMVELAGKHPPIDVMKASSSSLDIDFDEEAVDERDEKDAAARMQVICQFARESLLSYVKKDVNLTQYPGSIALPGDLFAPRLRSSQSPVNDYESEDEKPQKKSKPAAKPRAKKSTPASKVSSGKRKARSAPSPVKDDDDSEFGGSPPKRKPEPKSKKAAPASSGASAGKRKTRSAQSATDNDLSDLEDVRRSPSPAASPFSARSESPVATKDDESSIFGDGDPAFSPPFSPIAQADSPQAKLPSLLSVTAKPPARKTEKPSTGRASQKADNKKRKSYEVEPFNEFPSPLGMEEPSFLSSQGSSTKQTKRSKRSKSTPTALASSSANKPKKSSSSRKPTPVSVESKAMINITNTNSSKKTAGAKKKIRDTDEFDFPHSPPKSTIGRARNKKLAKSSPSTTSPSEPSPFSTRKGNRSSTRVRA
jgi:hypothetical protein